MAVDQICTRIMGFDEARIPLIQKARERKHFPLIRFRGADIEVCSNQDRWTGILHGNDPGLGFLPPKGWQGHIERHGL